MGCQALLLMVLAVGLAVSGVTTLQHVEALHSVADDEGMPKNKFTERKERQLLRSMDDSVRAVKEELFGVDYVTNNNGTCDHGVHLLWTSQVGSTIVATPRIVDLHSDGRKELLVPTFTQYIEAIDAENGEDVAGFPFAHPHFKSYSSPMPVDLNGDGILEWLVCTYNGELIFMEENGKVAKTIKVPPLPVKKNWRKNPAGGNHSTAERQLPPNAMNLKLQRLMEQSKKYDQQRVRVLPRQPTAPQPLIQHDAAQRKLAQVTDDPIDAGSDSHHDDPYGEADDDYHRGYDDYLHDVYGDEDNYGVDGADDSDERPLAPTTIGVDGWLSAEARSSMDLIFHPELYESSLNVEPEHDPFHTANMQSDNTVVVGSDEIGVDPHILSTPVVVDMDGDGTLDAILHVSYFFDNEYYSMVENQYSLPEDINMDDYVAEALLCVSLVTGQVKWLQLLHLTTKTVAQPAFGMSTPVVININGDLLFDVFVTTPLGFIFGFDGRGAKLNGWPSVMAPILGSPLAEDVNGDGAVDICAGDAKGNVACFRGDGHVLWIAQVAGAVTDSPMAGDVNGDGFIDVVVGTSAGGVYALDGRHGKVLNNFPVLAQGAIIAPPLLLNLNNTRPPALPESGKGLHVIVPSHDGYLYIVSGSTGCYEMVDIGEKSDSMVLADDLTGNGLLDLVVTTLSGSVIVYSTETPFHPLKAWTSRVKALNGATASEGHVGISIEEESRQPRDIRGDRFKMLITIHDDRAGKHSTFTPRYMVTVLVGTKIIVYTGMFLEAKTYTLELHAPLERLYATVRVVLSLPSGQHYEDSVALSFNMHFLETIKFLLLAPFLAFALALSFVKKEHTVKYAQYVGFDRRRQRYVYDDDY